MSMNFLRFCYCFGKSNHIADSKAVLLAKSEFSGYTFITMNEIPNPTKRHHLGVNKKSIILIRAFWGRDQALYVVMPIHFLTYFTESTILTRRGTLELRIQFF